MLNNNYIFSWHLKKIVAAEWPHLSASYA